MTQALTAHRHRRGAPGTPGASAKAADRAASLLAAALLAAGAASCSGDGADSAAGSAGKGVSMLLQVAMADVPAAGGGGILAAERMHTLRVVVTRQEGGDAVIEFNRLLRLGGAEGRWLYGYLDDPRLMFRMEEAGPRHLYLFANCDSILSETLRKAGIAGHPDPEDGLYNGGAHREEVSPEAARAYLGALREAVYTAAQLRECMTEGDDGVVTGLPMSAEHDVDVKPAPEDASYAPEAAAVSVPIVRAANKMTLTYVNARPRYPVFVQGWSLVSVADEAYLLPRVPQEANAGLIGPDGDWISWYRNHIGHHQAGFSDEPHGDELEFEAPSEAGCTPYNGTVSGESTYSGISGVFSEAEGAESEEEVSGLKVGGFDIKEGTEGVTADPAVYYFPETRYVPQGGAGQSYTMSFRTKEYQAAPPHYPSENGSYTDCPLPNVTTLFRGTHVKITATFKEGKQVNLQASIINWTEQDYGDGTLTPDTGTPAEAED